MTKLNDFERKTKQHKITHPKYGELHVCGNTDVRCGICLNDWNYKWEFDDINRVRTLLPSHSVGIDVGAHIGLYGIALKEKFDKLYSFEPLLCAYEALQKNSGIYKHLIPFNYYVDEKEDEKTISLDTFFHGNFFIDFIKIDVEGQEIRILKGAKNLIEYNENLIMLIEFEMKHLLLMGYTDKDFFDTLREVGLDCTDTYNKMKPLITNKFMTNLIIEKKQDTISCTYKKYFN